MEFIENTLNLLSSYFGIWNPLIALTYLCTESSTEISQTKSKENNIADIIKEK